MCNFAFLSDALLRFLKKIDKGKEYYGSEIMG